MYITNTVDNLFQFLCRGRKSSGKTLGSRPSTAAPLEEVDETQLDSPVPPTDNAEGAQGWVTELPFVC